MRLRLLASFTALALVATLLTGVDPAPVSALAAANWERARTLHVSSPGNLSVPSGRSFVSDDGRYVAYNEGRLITTGTPGVRPVAVVWDSAQRTTSILETPLRFTATSTPKALSADGRWVVVHDAIDGLWLVPNTAAGNASERIQIRAAFDPIEAAVTNNGAVAFTTDSRLLPTDTGFGIHTDVYLWEPARDSNNNPVPGTSTLELLTASSTGAALGSSGGGVAVTGDTLQVAHLHTGTGLGGGVPAGSSNAYVWDRTNGHQHIGTARAYATSLVDMSSDGRFVAADVPGGSRRWDRGPGGAGPAGAAEDISQSGGTGRGGALQAISNDGRFAVLNLITAEPGRPAGVWLRDMDHDFGEGGAFTLVNHHWNDRAVAGTRFGTPDIAGNGDVVSYHSQSNQLVPNDSGTDADVFTWWREGLPSFELPQGRQMGPHRITPPPATPPVGDPVNSWTGAYIDEVTDLASPAQGLSFELTRSYDSADPSSTMFGHGWAGPYDMRLEVTGGDVTVLFGAIAAATYLDTPSGYESTTPTVATLEPHGTGWRMHWPDGRRGTFDADGHLTHLVDRRGVGLSFTTTYYGAPATATDAAGRVHTFTYDTVGRLTAVTASDGLSVAYSYNTAGLLESFTDVRGNTTTYTYDDAGRLLTEVDANNHTVVENIYGSDGRVTSNTEAAGATHLYDWDEVSRTMTWTDGRGNDWTYVYNVDGQVISITDPEGAVTEFTYDTLGMVETITDAEDGVTTLSRDAVGRVVEQAGPVPDEVLEWSYNSDGSLASHTDGEDNTTEFTYTAGLLTRIDHPDGTFETFTHHPGTALVATHTNGAAETTSFDYDTAGNLTSTTTAEGRTTTFGYDPAGRVASRVDPRGNEPGADPDDHRWVFTYDPAGNPLTSTSPEGRVASFTYDDVGNRLTATTAAGSTVEASTAWAYDDGNWPVAVTDAEAATTEWTYDPAGNRTVRTDGTARSTTFEFDDANNGTSEIAPSGAEALVEFDLLGRPVTHTEAHDPQNPPSALNQTSVSYDEAGRVTSVEYDDPATADATYTYDRRGLRATMVDGAGTTTYDRDEMGRLTEVDGPEGVFTYTYDTAGRVATRALPDGRTLTYTRDDDGLVTAVTDGTLTISYAYDADGNLTSITSPNGAVETRGYDADGHLVAQTVVSGTTTLVAKAFTVDAAGRITRVDDAGTAAARATVTYGYDDTGRLTEECHQAACTGPSDPFTRWSYDNAGRRLSETTPAGVTAYSYDVDGNLEATTGPAGTTTYTYDAAGRRTAETGPGGTRSYTWDAAGRLASVTDTTGTTEFSYNGDGVRTGATGPGGDVALTWDPNDPLPQPVHVTVDDGTNTVDQAFVWGPAGAPAWATAGTAAGVDLQVVHTDQVWNPTVHTDAAGQVTHTVLGDAWGANSTVTAVNPTAPAPAVGHSSTVDAATAAGLVHMRARDYDPVTGQFLSPDPWVRPEPMAWVGVHAYTDGDPVSFWDPSGNCPGFMKNSDGGCIGAGVARAAWDARHEIAGVVIGGTCVVVSGGTCAVLVVGHFTVRAVDRAVGNGGIDGTWARETAADAGFTAFTGFAGAGASASARRFLQLNDELAIYGPGAVRAARGAAAVGDVAIPQACLVPALVDGAGCPGGVGGSSGGVRAKR